MERTEAVTSASAPDRVLSGSYVDLPAVLGGAILAAAAAGVFTSFGGALGFSSLSAEPGQSSLTLWLVISVIWLALTTVLSFAVGGYVTGRLHRRLDNSAADEVTARDGLNGLIVWGLGMLVVGWIAAGIIGGAAQVAGGAISAAGSVAGGAVQAAGAALSGAAQGVGAAAGDQDNGGAMSYLTDTLLRPSIQGAQQANGQISPAQPAADPAELSRQVGVVMGNVLKTGEISEEDKTFLINATAQKTGQSPADVEAKVNDAVKKVQDMRAEAAKMADEAKAKAIAAAETARKAGIVSAFIAAAVALAAAAGALIGGIMGGRHRDEGRIFGGLSYRH